jgi:3-deoxy-D-manno-octulosonic-acid transferase
MYFLYSIILSLGFLLMLPMFLFQRQKYASGLSQRLGNYPQFKHDGRKVIWLHCVSVGETNAARPLVEAVRDEFPDHRLVISTTTKTGQELARTIFRDKADAIFYFPFDWKFSVRRALANYKPSLVLLMETEIWPRFIHEANLSGARVAIVNGRLSAKSLRRYSYARAFVKAVLADIDMALMQGEADAQRLTMLGIDPNKITVTGNLKFDFTKEPAAEYVTESFRRRFGIPGQPVFIVAASTHDNEEKLLLDALKVAGGDYRLLIAPRHPERFDEVARILGPEVVRRSQPERAGDRAAQFILLDTIGDLRNLFELADIVFVGGSLIPHGGQSVLEPAAAGKAIVTGPYTFNFESIISDFRRCDALVQLPVTSEREIVAELHDALQELISDSSRRDQLGRNARAVIEKSRGATQKTVDIIKDFVAS